MKRLYTKDELLLILNYARASKKISSQCYRSMRNTHIVHLTRFLRNFGFLKD